MESSDEKLTSQFYVQMPPNSQSHQGFTDFPEDIHICGLCKQSFSDIHVFLQHKTECSVILATTSNSLVDNQVNYVISDQSLFRISGLSFDNTSLPIFIQSEDTTDKLTHALRSHLINTNDQEPSKKDDLQINEEDVASLLVNQLSKEVLNSSPIEIGNKGSEVHNIEIPGDLAIDNEGNSTQNLNELIVNNAQDDVLSKKTKAACSVCNFVPRYPRDLNRHMKKHTGERPYECSVCNRRFARHDKLQTHKRIHSGDKPYQCQLCSYATTDSGPLRKHLRIHTDERPHKCQMCPYRARDSSQLTVHLRTHTGDCPFICQVETCGKAFKTSTDLRRHTSIHTRNVNVTNNKQTAKGNPSQTVGSEKQESEGTPFPCPLVSCDYIGTSLRDLRSHSKFHSGSSDVNNRPKEVNKISKSNTKTSSCHICSSNYRHKSNQKCLQSLLKKHQLLTSSGIMRPICTKSHHCHLCSAAFVRADSLRSHLRQHQQNGTLQVDFEGFVNKNIESLTIRSDGITDTLDIAEGQTDSFELLVTTNTQEPRPPL